MSAKRRIRRGLINQIGHRLAVPLGDEAAEVAAGDVLVFEAGGGGAQVGMLEADDAGMGALADDAPQQGRFVPQPFGRRRVEAELERDRGWQEGVLGLPDLAEAAHTQQLLQVEVADARRPIPGLEARKLRGQQGQQVLLPLQGQAGGHRAAGGVGRAALRLADGDGDLRQVGHQGRS
jgi:hypothetical protein